MPETRIRRARPSDLGGLLSLEALCFQPFRRASRRSLRRSLLSPRQSVWVVDRPGGGLAALLVLWHHPRRVRVYDVATHPALRGQGLGHRMMGHAERLARRSGCAFLTLEADPRERGLVAWYQRQGFQAVARLAGFYAAGRPAVRMRKRLAQEG